MIIVIHDHWYIHQPFTNPSQLDKLHLIRAFDAQRSSAHRASLSVPTSPASPRTAERPAGAWAEENNFASNLPTIVLLIDYNRRYFNGI